MQANLKENTHAKVRFQHTEIALWHACSPGHLLHIFRTTFIKNILDWRAASGQKIMAGLNNWLFFVDYKLIF